MEIVIKKDETLDRIADNVRHYMGEMSANELARRSETDKMIVSRLLRKKMLPRADVLYRIASVLEIPMDYLFQE